MASAIGKGLNTISSRRGFGDSLRESSEAAGSRASQGMVGFALTLPILILLILGIIGFRRLLFTHSAVTTVAREAARNGSSVGGLDSTNRNYQHLAAHRPASQSAR